MAEITLQDEFGHHIYNTIKMNGYFINLEIGSWDGMGSTQCLIKAMNELPDDDRKKLQCIEIKPERYDVLCTNLLNVAYVHKYNMNSINRESFLPRSFDEIWDSPFNKHKKFHACSKELVRSWYEEDLQTFTHEGFLNSDDVLSRYDAVLIDGSEFTGYSEFTLLKDRTRCFILDDVHKAYKCNQVYEELKCDSDWELLSENSEVRNGFAIFKRK